MLTLITPLVYTVDLKAVFVTSASRHRPFDTVAREAGSELAYASLMTAADVAEAAAAHLAMALDLPAAPAAKSPPVKDLPAALAAKLYPVKAPPARANWLQG